MIARNIILPKPQLPNFGPYSCILISRQLRLATDGDQQRPLISPVSLLPTRPTRPIRVVLGGPSDHERHADWPRAATVFTWQDATSARGLGWRASVREETSCPTA